MLTIGEWFALSSALSWAVAVICFKRAGETLSPAALNLFKTTLGTALLALTLMVWPQLEAANFTANDFAIMIVSGVLGIAIADGMYFMALNAIGASRTGLASSLFSPFVVSLSFAFLDESLRLFQWLGLILVVASIFFYAYKPDPREVSPTGLRRGVLIAVCAVFLMAAGIVMVKPVLDKAPLLWVVEIRFMAGAVGMVIWYAMRRRLGGIVREYRRQQSWTITVAGSIFGGYLGMILWVGGYKYAQASVASVLNETAAMFILILSWLFLRESMGPRKVACVVLSFAGVLALVLG